MSKVRKHFDERDDEIVRKFMVADRLKEYQPHKPLSKGQHKDKQRIKANEAMIERKIYLRNVIG